MLKRFIIQSGLKRRVIILLTVFTVINYYLFIRTRACLPDSWNAGLKGLILGSYVAWPITIALAKYLMSLNFCRIAEVLNIIAYNYFGLFVYTFMVVFGVDALRLLNYFFPVLIPSVLLNNFSEYKSFVFYGALAVVAAFYAYGKYHWTQIQLKYKKIKVHKKLGTL